MTIVIGVSPSDAGLDALDLGALLGNLLAEECVLAYVTPPTVDYPSPGHVDAEWAAYLREQSSKALAEACEYLVKRWGVAAPKTLSISHSSVSRGLSEAAQQVDASLVVLGPGGDIQGGRVTLGSAAHSLVHGAGVGIALAPFGYHQAAPGHIDRLVVGFRDESQARHVLAWAGEVAARSGVAVQLLSVILRVTRIVTSRLGHDPERVVLQALHDQEQQAQNAVVKGAEFPVSGTVVQGETAADALRKFAWAPGDVFVMGSSRFGAVRRVFMGDTSMKLLRAATVPIVILPNHEQS